ncbi:glutathione S-transferase [Rhizobium sullae]|uniref:Glutathione S-transferase n=1 Tax=Rhizobium sullae TaxID=50338 RepID=A0A2N0DAX9_RHISU|nr:glutathione binding-like protein [Rhizobium sullae]PKA43224.1 glutathione S-transferase [Rhizobium sullae]
MLKLFLSPGSSSMAPHIALHEVGADFEICSVSFARREHRDPAYLAINPEGKVPTLLVDDRPLTEVAGILFFLAKRFPHAGLLPVDDPEAEAHVLSWMSFLASTVHPARRRGVEHALDVYRIVEKRLGERPFVVGSKMSVADIHLFRLFWRFRRSANLAPGALPLLEAFHDRMRERPAVRKTLEIEENIGYELPS